MIGNEAFQEADTIGITRPITNHNYLVTERAEVGAILKSAIFIAHSGLHIANAEKVFRKLVNKVQAPVVSSLLGIGVRFDDRATGVIDKFAPHANIVHIDIDPVAIARNVKVDVPIVSDAKTAVETLLPMVEKADIEETGSYLSPGRVIKEISREFSDVIISTEVGQNQMWAALFYNFQVSRTWLTSGGLGTMATFCPTKR